MTNDYDNDNDYDARNSVAIGQIHCPYGTWCLIPQYLDGECLIAVSMTSPCGTQILEHGT